MLDFLTTGYIPSVVLAVITTMMIIGFYVFVIPILQDNKQLRQQVEDLSEELSNCSSVYADLLKTNSSNMSDVKECLDKIMRITNECNSVITKHTTIHNAQLLDSIERQKTEIMKIISNNETKISSLLTTCDTMRETQLSVMSILYGTRFNGVSSSQPSGPSHLK